MLTADSFRRAVGVACDIVADVATGLARTVEAAASTLAVAVLAEESDPVPDRRPWVPPPPPPFAPLPAALLRDLAERGVVADGGSWFERVPFSPWLPQDWLAPDDLAGLGDTGADGPVAP